MKIAIIGSRGLNCEIPENFIPKNTTQLISGGAIGIDTKAREYAIKHNIQIIEVLPEYDLFGKKAPLVRNDVIVDLSDMVLAFWDGKSRGTRYVINRCLDLNKSICVFKLGENGYEEDFTQMSLPT